VKHEQALLSRGDTNILLLNSVHVAGIGPINCLNVPGHAFRGSLILAIPRLVCEYCAIAFTKQIFEVQVTEIHEDFYIISQKHFWNQKSLLIAPIRRRQRQGASDETGQTKQFGTERPGPSGSPDALRYPSRVPSSKHDEGGDKNILPFAVIRFFGLEIRGNRHGPPARSVG
jgi:hypothetical protein